MNLKKERTYEYMFHVFKIILKIYNIHLFQVFVENLYISDCSIFVLKNIESNFGHHTFKKDVQKWKKSQRKVIKIMEVIKIIENRSNKKELLHLEKQG